MKRLVAVIATIAIATCLATTASAFLMGWAPLQGTYEMVGVGSCLHSTTGFTNLKPSPPTSGGPEQVVWAAAVLAHGTWKFERDTMRGTVSLTNDPIDFPPFATPGARHTAPTLTFSYAVSTYNNLTVTFDNPNLPPLEGRIAWDRKTVILWNSNLVQPVTGTTPASAAICNVARVLLKVIDFSE